MLFAETTIHGILGQMKLKGQMCDNGLLSISLISVHLLLKTCGLCVFGYCGGYSTLEREKERERARERERR